MAVNEKRLQVTELDFDNIKNNLKVFLKGQTQFKDYDFEGSGMNILLDTLAYNTHYMAFNANMVANEMFLDSSSLRSSVVSHAKALGYEVTSARAPIATVNIVLTTTAATKTMPAGTAFTTTVDGLNYQFVTINDITSSNIGNAVNFDSTKIYEGTYVTTKYVVDTSDVDQRFILTDPRTDTTTLTVKVQTSATDTTTTTYTKATDISQLTSSSKVYYLQEIEAGRFEVYFGDGVVSGGLSDGNIVVLQYVVTNKSASNGAGSFSAPSSIDGVTGIVVTTVSSATGGAEPESINSIKLNAPLNYAAQGRAVTVNDYKTFVRRLFPNTQAVSVFGGEDGSFNSSTGVSSIPEYGKVFISIKSTTGNNLTLVQKNDLITALAPFKVSSITPVIVDAETTSLILNTTIQYDSTSTTQSASDLEALVNTTISNYNTDELQTFNAPFRHSKLLGLIDNTDTAILNNTTTVTLAKLFTPTLSVSTNYNLNFNNKFFNPHSGHNASGGGIISSTGFFLNNLTTTTYFFDDDGVGNLRVYSLVSGERVYLDSTAGTVDYINGTIAINAIIITGVADVDDTTSTQIRVTVIPNSYDVTPVRNQILEIDLVNTTVTAGVDATATTGVGFTTSQTVTATGATATTTTVSSTPSTPSSSAY
tara:strand:- start:18580 stop:20526 length:1947 start_codon:yes stop_codon:yes gene_type:complete